MATVVIERVEGDETVSVTGNTVHTVHCSIVWTVSRQKQMLQTSRRLCQQHTEIDKHQSRLIQHRTMTKEDLFVIKPGAIL